MKPKPRYVEGISDDLYVGSPHFGARAALAMDLLSFCTECGCVVYRRDLHDQWHDRVTMKPVVTDPPNAYDLSALKRKK